MAANLMANRSAQVGAASRTRPAAFSINRCRRVIVKAAAETAQQPAAVATDFKAPPILTWPEDKETARDVFSVSGPLPERLNGRLAMLGFTGIALAELSSKQPALEQIGDDWFGVLLLSVALTLASVFPKLVSGSSLADLHSSATSENLKGEGVLGQLLQLFDTNVELWLGRLAMIGVSGLVVLEAVTGNTTF